MDGPKGRFITLLCAPCRRELLIFAELQYAKHYDDMHDELVDFIKVRFKNTESGHQGDSWIWILDGNDKVQIDTFTSMKHQIKSPLRTSKLVRTVIRELESNYSVNVYPTPESEAHEE